MGRTRNNGLSEEKRNIIGQFVEMYDIKTGADIQEREEGNPGMVKTPENIDGRDWDTVGHPAYHVAVGMGVQIANR